MSKFVLVTILVVSLVSGCIPAPVATETVIPTSPTATMSEAPKAPKGYITLWFDDGLLSTYEVAYPVLAQQGWKSVIAVVSDQGVAREKFNPDGDPVMDWSQIEELAEAGWEISNHSATHSHLNEFAEDADFLDHEIAGSKQQLQNLGFVVNSFTFPYGENGERTGQQIVSNNYLYWRSSVEEINPVPAWRHITSMFLTTEVGQETLQSWIRETEQAGGWLIIGLHAIVEKPANPWQHTREHFEMLLEAIKKSNLEVVLPSEMFGRFGYAEGETPILATVTPTSTPAPTATPVPHFKKEYYGGEIRMQIPKISVDAKLEIACKISEIDYDFSSLHEAPVWVCPDGSPYLGHIGLPGVAIVLGHRQWGPLPKVFAKINKLEPGDEVLVSNAAQTLIYQVQGQVEVLPEDIWQEIAKFDIKGAEEDRSFLILITCTPYGTDLRRLLLISELVAKR